MIIDENVICKTCGKVFCCAECRRNHANKEHAIIVYRNTPDSSSMPTTIHLFCPICECKPLVLHAEMHKEMLQHIEQNHLPLNCQKCSKVYTKIDDLMQFTKCIQSMDKCVEEQKLLGTNEKSSEAFGNSGNAGKTQLSKTMATTVSTQTSPVCGQYNSNISQHITPISLINLRWKAKSKLTNEEFIGDSVSSIKNISCINNSSLRRSIGIGPTPGNNQGSTNNQGKLVRSTSTPLHNAMVFAKPREQTFNVSGGHVSSIYNSGSESDISPPINHPMGTPQTKLPLDNMNRYKKVCGLAKISAVTPLRQVMSKSIQKAIAEHGIATGLHRKKMFESIDTSSGVVERPPASSNSPIDLRLSPVVRRTQSETLNGSSQSKKILNSLPSEGGISNSSNLRQEILLSSKKTTTESIVITRTQQLASVEKISSNRSAFSSNYLTSNQSNQSNGSSSGSVYQTCSNVEIITAMEVSEFNIARSTYTPGIREETGGEILKFSSKSENMGSSNPPITPITRIPGAIINKKIINFETPQVESTKETHKQPSPEDIFYTPYSTPVRKMKFIRDKSDAKIKRTTSVVSKLFEESSPLRRPSIRRCHSQSEAVKEQNSEEEGDDAVFSKESSPNNCKKQAEPAAQGRLWSIVSSVIRLPSLTGSSYPSKGDDKESSVFDENSTSIIKRCASFAGSLVRTKSFADDNQKQTLKRKRTYTNENHPPNHLSKICGTQSSGGQSSKHRIQGRKPIKRMRINS